MLDQMKWAVFKWLLVLKLIVRNQSVNNHTHNTSIQSITLSNLARIKQIITDLYTLRLYYVAKNGIQ